MKIVGACACIMGVAHTYMAAEALENECKRRGYEVKIETQGTVGFENKLTAEDIASADAVILTNDIPIRERERFEGCKIFNVSSTGCIKSADKILDAVEKNLD